MLHIERSWPFVFTRFSQGFLRYRALSYPLGKSIYDVGFCDSAVEGPAPRRGRATPKFFGGVPNEGGA